MDTNIKKIDRRLIAACAVMTAVIIAAPIIGFSVPKGDMAVNRNLTSLHKRDTKYMTARDTKNTENEEKTRLEEKLADKKEELVEFQASQDNLDKITENNASLEAEKEKLETDIRQKQNKLKELDISLGKSSGRTLTWASGDYTVGTDIAEGKYKISGSGSIAIANSGRAKTNKELTAGGETFSLNSGDRVHIDGSASLTPQQGGDSSE